MVFENLVSVRVWGDFACFTRPELKVERVSYPLMTPSAARGILEAIFWEPQMYYVVNSIHVLKKGRWLSIRRNEVTKVVNLDTLRLIRAGGGASDGTQRGMLALAEVDYVISAHIHLSGLGLKTGPPLIKYQQELQQRAQKGKCFHRPALGMREFAADFDWVEDPNSFQHADWADEELGFMLYDFFDPVQRAKGFRWLTNAEYAAQTVVAGLPAKRYEGVLVKPQAVFFDAAVHNACLACHPDRVRMVTSSLTKESGNPCS